MHPFDALQYMGFCRRFWTYNFFCPWRWECCGNGWLGWLGSDTWGFWWSIEGCALLGICLSGGLSIVPYRHAYRWLVEGRGILSWCPFGCELLRLLDVCRKFWCIRHRQILWCPLMIGQSHVHYRLLVHWFGGHKGGVFYIVILGFRCRLQIWFCWKVRE